MSGPITIELADPTGVLLREIQDPKCRRNDVAKTYNLALRSSVETDFAAVNNAIIARWSRTALEWIKRRAWSGKCFETAVTLRKEKKDGNEKNDTATAKSRAEAAHRRHYDRGIGIRRR